MNSTKIKIPYVNLGLDWKKDKKKILKKISNFLDRGTFIGGEEIKKFENNISSLCKTKFCVGTNSGTDALTLGMYLMGIKRGDEVITPANSFIASTASIVHLGATPVFADIDDDLNIDPKDIENKITKKTKAIMPVHLTGRVAKMNEILEIAKKNKIEIIEDAAQSIGSKYYDKMSGSFGKVSCFSAHPLKNLNAIGDSGYLITNDKSIFLKSKLLINHGIENNSKVNHFGFVSRMDSFQALILNYQLKKLKKTISVRRKNAKIYNLELANFVQVPEEKSYEYNTYHTYIIKTDKRNLLRKHLLEDGIETKIHYPIPIHLQKAAKKFNYKKGSLPNTEKSSRQILTLPINQHLNENDLSRIINSIKKFFHG